MSQQSKPKKPSHKLQTTSTQYSIYPSRRQTQTQQSTCNKILAQYNIQDYLPPPQDHTFKHIAQISTNKFTPISIHTYTQSHLQQQNKNSQSKYSQMMQLVENTKKQITQLKQQNQSLTNKINQLNKQLEQSDKKCQLKNIEIQNLHKKYNMEIQASNQQREKQKKKKENNIRIFCQKYELVLHPKIRHSYTVQVQTYEADLPVMSNHSSSLKNINRNARTSSLNNENHVNHANTPQPYVTFNQWNNNNNNNPKTNYYQMYQSKINTNNNINPNMMELSNQPTTRSQILSSNHKVNRPKFMGNNTNDTHKDKLRERIQTKQNDRNRGNFNNVSTEYNNNKSDKNMPYKIKDEELEIYPIEDEHLEDVIQGVLAYLK